MKKKFLYINVACICFLILVILFQFIFIKNKDRIIQEKTYEIEMLKEDAKNKQAISETELEKLKEENMVLKKANNLNKPYIDIKLDMCIEKCNSGIICMSNCADKLNAEWNNVSKEKTGELKKILKASDYKKLEEAEKHFEKYFILQKELYTDNVSSQGGTIHLNYTSGVLYHLLKARTETISFLLYCIKNP